MRNRVRQFALAALIFVMMSSSMFLLNRTSVMAANQISISPSTVSVTVGQDFTVDVNLDFAAQLYGFQFYLSFDKNKLNALSINDPGYLNPPTHVWLNTIDNTTGFVGLSISTQGAIPGKTGGGTLATIQFRAIGPGSSSLHLYNAILVDDQGLQLLPATSDGTVNIAGGALPVGGNWEPIDMFKLLGPCIAYVALIVSSGAMLGLFKRRLKKEIS